MIPAVIQALLPQQLGEENRIGLSGAQVVMYEDCVLKVQPDTGNAANEGIMLRFLKGRLPVPEVLAEAEEQGQPAMSTFQSISAASAIRRASSG